MDLQQLKSLLHSGVAQVTFKKINGDIRIMDCTLNGELIPPSAWPEGKVQISEEAKSRTLRVFDVKAQGWRSFLIANIIEVK
jgi:hypothetical protein